jgi:hypothetical protein
MSTYDNPKLGSRITPDANGALYIDRQITDLSDTAQVPASLDNGDLVQIGVVPAGTKLVPRLSTLQVPKLDTNGAATGKFKIGTSSTADALVAETSAGSSVSDLQTNFKDVEIGSATDDTKIYLTLSAALATQATSGKIKFDLALRAWDSVVDG